MYTTYRLQADELSDNFIKAVKQTYKHCNIEIIVQEVQDETEYLLSSKANKEHLLRSIRCVRRFSGMGCPGQENLHKDCHLDQRNFTGSFPGHRKTGTTKA